MKLEYPYNQNPPEWNPNYANIELSDPEPGNVINKDGPYFAIDSDNYATEIDYDVLPNNDGSSAKYDIDKTDQKINIVLKTVPDTDTNDVLRIKVSSAKILFPLDKPNAKN